MNVPLVVGDATSLNESGYCGDDVESRLLEATWTLLNVASSSLMRSTSSRQGGRIAF